MYIVNDTLCSNRYVCETRAVSRTGHKSYHYTTAFVKVSSRWPVKFYMYMLMLYAGWITVETETLSCLLTNLSSNFQEVLKCFSHVCWSERWFNFVKYTYDSRNFASVINRASLNATASQKQPVMFVFTKWSFTYLVFFSTTE